MLFGQKQEKINEYFVSQIVMAEDFDGKYVIGNDMDKMMSGARVILDTDNKVSKCIDSLWDNITQRMVDHHLIGQTGIDPHTQNLSEMLVRYNRFSLQTIADCRAKTIQGVRRAMNTANIKPANQLDKMAFIISQKCRRID